MATSYFNSAVDTWQHYLVKYYISKNNPLIVTAAKGTHVTGEGKWYLGKNMPGIYRAASHTIAETSEEHAMPIIGWKTESYSGWCAKRIWPNRNWFLLDSEFDFKQYVRFDSRSRYWKIGAISYIWSR